MFDLCELLINIIGILALLKFSPVCIYVKTENLNLHLTVHGTPQTFLALPNFCVIQVNT